MAPRIPPKEATLITTLFSALVGTGAVILISSIYVKDSAGWPQFCLNAFSAAAVCTIGASALGYAAHQQFVVKKSLFTDHDDEFDYGSIGQWAVVTGATDGIGKEYARQVSNRSDSCEDVRLREDADETDDSLLAVDHGMDVLLVGRNPKKLKDVAELIRNECKGRRQRVMTVVADLVEDPVARDGRCGAGVGKEHVAEGPKDEDVADRCFCASQCSGRCTRWYPRLRAVIEGFLQTSGGVGVLINCAGVCYPHPEYFAGMQGDLDGPPEPVEFTTDFCRNAEAAVRCNVGAAVHVCRLVLPGMLARGQGLVVNVGSAMAAVREAPLMALYAANKKFLEKLSADLDTECAYLTRKSDDGYGVRVQCVEPAYVATAMLRSANPDVRVVTGDDDEVPDDQDYGDKSWWTGQMKQVEAKLERWMVPSARQWVRSALRKGGRLYANANGPVSFTGYWPHTLLVWCLRLASVLIPRWLYVDGVLIPAMLKYRAKGRMTTAGA